MHPLPLPAQRIYLPPPKKNKLTGVEQEIQCPHHPPTIPSTPIPTFTKVYTCVLGCIIQFDSYILIILLNSSA